MSISIITAPATEPLLLIEAKDHLRVALTETADDAIITALITVARQSAEAITGRALITQTLELSADAFPEWTIQIPRPPLVSVTTIKYIDTDGVEQTFAASKYLVDTYREPARLTPAYGESWPSSREQNYAVLIRYVAGYGAASAVPQAIKQWMLIKIGEMYANREASIATSITEFKFVDELLFPYRALLRAD